MIHPRYYHLRLVRQSVITDARQRLMSEED